MKAREMEFHSTVLPHLLIVDFQKRSLQYELGVLLPLLKQLKKVEERPEYQPVIRVLQIRLPLAKLLIGFDCQFTTCQVC